LTYFHIQSDAASLSVCLIFISNIGVSNNCQFYSDQYTFLYAINGSNNAKLIDSNISNVQQVNFLCLPTFTFYTHLISDFMM